MTDSNGLKRWSLRIGPSVGQQHGIELDVTQTPARTRDAPKAGGDGNAPSQETANEDEKAPFLEHPSTAPAANHTQRLGWTFTSPAGDALESNALLKIVHKPAWQGVAQYTMQQRSRRHLNCITCGCVAAEATSTVTEEVYTSKDIVLHKNTKLSIRGIGQCDGVQLYLRPHSRPSTHVDDADLPVPIKQDFQKVLREYDQRSKGNREMYPMQWDRFQQPHDSQEKSILLDESTHNRNPRAKNEEEATDAVADHVDINQLICVTFAMPTTAARFSNLPLLWKVELPPAPYSDAYLDTITVFEGSVDMGEPASHIYIQGYQSWSYTGSIPRGSKQPRPALPSTFSGAFNAGASMPLSPSFRIQDGSRMAVDNLRESTTQPTFAPRTAYKSDFFTCLTTSRDEPMDEIGGPAVVLGWLAQHQQLGLVLVDAGLRCAQMSVSHKGLVTSRISTDWCYAQLVAPHHYDEEPMADFLHAVASHNEARPLQNGPLLTGWCSWYHYYEDISEGALRSNFARLEGMRKVIPTNVSVVDDGYMTAWGDWDNFKPGKFTDMRVVARDIEANSMRPGLWLAPYTCDKHSKVAKDHPDWIIHNDHGIPANSSNCGKFFYGLDATNPEVREYVSTCIRRAVQDWGFDVLKIDFLYAACLEGNGKFDPSMTRAQTMHLALATIRKAAGPDVFLIGCGCPIGAGIGYVDGMRVSADTGPTWYPAFPLPWWDNGTLPALRSMIRNSINRAPMGHRWWHNDPDCLLLGTSTSLTDIEVTSAASIIAMTCGMLLLSDDLTKVIPSRTSILTKIFPMTGVSAVILDLHSAPAHGLPSMLRLWCTDKEGGIRDYHARQGDQREQLKLDSNHAATHFGRLSSFQLDQPAPHPNERQRSCLHVADNVGTWTMLSVSNWSDEPSEVRVPRTALQTPHDAGKLIDSAGRDGETSPNSLASRSHSHNGYHVFSFWSGQCQWIDHTTPTADTQAEQNGGGASTKHEYLSRRLQAHETEIFHVRPVTPSRPQYIGSDIHFSCGLEVDSFNLMDNNTVEINLKRDLERLGKYIYVFVPVINTASVRVKVGGKQGTWSIHSQVPQKGGPNSCGSILRIAIDIKADGSEDDGMVSILF